ncbi:MAG: arginine--tRNA ligase [Candidatus Micrarchaeota archaeon]|nr:arginine--tRNA ligase [Candidatus Micrarchaeota archaeon]
MHSNPAAQVRAEFIGLVKASIKGSFGIDLREEELSPTLSTPKNEIADLSTSICFRLAKEFKKSPREIAQRVASEARPTKLILTISELNGYVNATFDRVAYSRLVMDAVNSEKERYGASEIGKQEKVIVEFPSVNPNKPWHVGHVRNAVLGNAISNILSFNSYLVEREDYIDDLGLQMAESLWGLKNLDAKPDKKYDQWLGEQYVEVNKRLAAQPDLKHEMDLMLKSLEDLNSEESRMVREMAQRCMLAQRETASAYQIYHDVMIWESDILRAKLLEKALELATRKGVMEKASDETKYKGSLIVKMGRLARYDKEFAGNEEEAKIIVRSNGAATYIAKDFAFHLWKFGIIEAGFRYQKFIEKQQNSKSLYTTSSSGEERNFGNVKKAVNIIDASQKYEQQVMRAMFALVGHEEAAKNLIHLAYGRVTVAGTGLSTRKGTWMGDGKNYTGDDLLREVKDAAYKIVSQSEKITDKSSFEMIANAVALSAIKFEFLKFAPETEITFSWEKALNFEGDSGPSCLYTYARATRVLEKGEYKNRSPDPKAISRGEDFEIIKHIGEFPSLVEKVGEEYRPNLITDYVIMLSSLFGKFYEKMPIINGGDAKETRLQITSCVRQTMGNALRLLGIEPIERM